MFEIKHYELLSLIVLALLKDGIITETKGLFL